MLQQLRHEQLGSMVLVPEELRVRYWAIGTSTQITLVTGIRSFLKHGKKPGEFCVFKDFPVPPGSIGGTFDAAARWRREVLLRKVEAAARKTRSDHFDRVQEKKKKAVQKANQREELARR